MLFIGYCITILIGISLGLVGGGGSILMIPLLVYIFKLPPVLSTSYSLFIIGITSVVGATINFIKGNASFTLALPLGIVSPITVFAIRHYVLPKVPEQINLFKGHSLETSLVLMVLFALLMLMSALGMLKETNQHAFVKKANNTFAIIQLCILGVIIGCITGFLGAGGGFLIVPALVMWIHLPMRQAIGTSLFIIAINSLIGFAGDWGHYSIDWELLSTLTTLAVLGIGIGSSIAIFFKPQALKKGFAVFILVMGVFIVIKEIVSF